MKLISTLLLIPTIAIGQSSQEDLCKNIDEIIKLDQEQNIGASYKDNLVEMFNSQTSGTSNANTLKELDSNWYLSGLYYQKGLCYLNGVSVEKDINKAKEILKKSVSLNNKQAKYVLASINLFGSENPDDWKSGINVLLEEYKAGSFYSAGKIGWAYHLGRGVEKDDKKALELYTSAAQNGMTQWQYLLAHAYEQGYYGLPKDNKMVTYWLNYKPKVHKIEYNCTIYGLYNSGRSFPNNTTAKNKYEQLCNDTANK